MTEVFWTFLITSSIGLLLAIGRLCYKSKCKNIKMCGCINIQRDVATEHKELEFETIHPRKTESKEMIDFPDVKV